MQTKINPLEISKAFVKIIPGSKKIEQVTHPNSEQLFMHGTYISENSTSNKTPHNPP